jgi:hypothetical protein
MRANTHTHTHTHTYARMHIRNIGKFTLVCCCNIKTQNRTGLAPKLLSWLLDSKKIYHALVYKYSYKHMHAYGLLLSWDLPMSKDSSAIKVVVNN